MDSLSTQLSAEARPKERAKADRRQSGFTLVELLVVIVIIGILAGLLIPAIVSALNEAKLTACANNLTQLYKTLHLYGVRTHGKMPSERGEAFWLKFQQMTPPLLDPSMAEVYFCKKKGEEPALGATDYRGPADNPARYEQGDPIGADKSDNHGPGYGINVLRLSGDVLRVHPDEPLWALCDSKLQ